MIVYPLQSLGEFSSRSRVYSARCSALHGAGVHGTSDGGRVVAAECTCALIQSPEAKFGRREEGAAINQRLPAQLVTLLDMLLRG